ncbi:LemA family protein [Blastococcus deserti]|uniref:LemA protein n=1 Tax=Blastococcus deserti TaxID=2259033 RepID=A0ABW4XC72_9ACTN
MTPDAWLLTLGALLLVLLAWTVWTLTRLRRLEARVARAWAALDGQLRRRAALAEELARDHAGALGEHRAAALAAAAAGARSPRDGDRETAENALGRELRDLPADLPGVPGALQADLAGTSTRVGLARRFYNDAVRDIRALRRHRFPRLLRLHAGRPLPRYFDIDDRLEEVVGALGGNGRGVS